MLVSWPLAADVVGEAARNRRPITSKRSKSYVGR
jgi:hypothetical protein